MAGSHDPNALIGPAGFGTSHFIPTDTLLPYQIDFENSPSATAPAQQVVITDSLDPNLDWRTLQLTGVGFGDTNIVIPVNSQYFATTLLINQNGKSFDVEIEIDFSSGTGLLTATIQSIDPNTQLPPDLLTGFLPPEDGTGRGMGYISFIVDPKAELPTGAEIHNVALITFDANPAIATDQVNDDDPAQGVDPSKQDLNTIDSGPPTSSVAPLPATETSSGFTVAWSSMDDPTGSGIAFYNVYASEDGGSYSLWQADTTLTSAMFTGAYGHTYSFFSTATDNVGNVEGTPAAAEATTRIVGSSVTTTTTPKPSDDSPTYGDSLTFTVTVAPDPSQPGTPTGTVQFIVDGAHFGTPVALTSGIATTPATMKLTAGAHTISAVYSGDITFTNSTSGDLHLIVAKATVTVTADNKSKIYGAPDPTLTYTVVGLLDGDSASVISGVRLSTTTGTAATVGTHAITVTGGNAANYTITDVPGTFAVTASTSTPPPLVTITHVQPQTNKKHRVSQILVKLSGPVNATEAGTVNTYRLATAGKKGSFDAKNAKLIKLKSAVYNAAKNTVTLTPKKPFALTKPVQLRINGQPPSGLQDSLGRLIDGDHNGQAGGNAVALLRRGGAAISAVTFHSPMNIRLVEASAPAETQLATMRVVERIISERRERDDELLSLYQEVTRLMANGESVRTETKM